MSTELKYRHLLKRLCEADSIVVAFSGGVDSSLLLCAAHEALGDGCLGVTVRSPLHPAWETAQAEAIASLLGVHHRMVGMNELDDNEFRNNPPNRCYLCKRRRLEALIQFAKDNGFAAVAEGSNVDDSNDYRPGKQAVCELGVLSPLADVGLRKEEIRNLAKLKGLPNWDAPAMACLASRVPYHVTITPAILEQIDRSEQTLREMGFRTVRVRHHGAVGRIEIPMSDLNRAFDEGTREKIVSALRQYGYHYVVIDMEGYRTGALNQVLGSEETKTSDPSSGNSA
jgi:uncharacterized protein